VDESDVAGVEESRASAMHIEIVRVPLSDPTFEIRVIALHRGKDAGPFGYLEAARQHTNKALGQRLDQIARVTGVDVLVAGSDKIGPPQPGLEGLPSR
jgi:hypothetical protein